MPVWHRGAIGKTEIKEALGTADVGIARVRHAARFAEVCAMFAGLYNSMPQAPRIVRTRSWHRLRRLGPRQCRFNSEMDGFDLGRGLDNVYCCILRMLGFDARLDRGSDYAGQAQREESFVDQR